MCIIIDTNVLASVFSENSANHEDFIFVKDWIIGGNGKIVLGGTKYLNEAKGKYLAFFHELNIRNKAVIISKEKVDSEEKTIAKTHKHPNFNDQHLIALLKISNCKLICSLDKNAYPFFKSKNLIKTKHIPKIYSSKKNKNLLNDNNIADICLPCVKLSKNTRLKLKYEI